MVQMPPEWLGETFLKQAERLKRRDERAYRHMYLGEAVGTGGRVFEQLEIREIPQEEREMFPVRYAGLDFGFASDPDALVLCAWDKRGKRLLVLEENVQTGQTLEKLAENCRKLAGERIIRCDSAAPREIAELRRKNVNAIGAKKGAGSVEHGIRWLKALNAIVIDRERCPMAAREFSLYEYARSRDGSFLNECPDRNNHTIDAVRYALEPLMTERVVRLRKGRIE